MKKYMYDGKLFNSVVEIEDYVELNFNGFWNAEYIPVEVVEFGLVKGRHDIPVDTFIFNSIEDVLDFGMLEHMAGESIPKDADVLVIYVTGLTSATIAAINVAKMYGYKSIILKHYDNVSGNYLSQWVY